MFGLNAAANGLTDRRTRSAVVPLPGAASVALRDSAPKRSCRGRLRSRCRGRLIKSRSQRPRRWPDSADRLWSPVQQRVNSSGA